MVFEITPRFYFSSEAESSVQRARKSKCFVGDVTDEDFKSLKHEKFVFSLAKQKIAEQNSHWKH